MPLVQRHESEIETPATPVIEAAPPERPAESLAQRQAAVTAPPPPQPSGEEAALPALPAIEKTAPAGPEMPPVQRKAAEAPPPGPAQPPRQEVMPPAAPEMPLVQRQAVEVEPPVGPGVEAAPHQEAKMPLVQRQPAATGSAPAPLSHEEAPPKIESKLPDVPAGGETLPGRPEVPRVQRLPREETSQVETGPAPVQRTGAPGEPAAGLEGEIVARAASRTHLPLVEPPHPAQVQAIQTKPVEQTAILPQARGQAGPEPPALAPLRPGTSTGGLPAQTGWTHAATGELPLPPPLQRSAAPARPASTTPSTLIQRQPEPSVPSPVVTARPEPWGERIVQRDDGEEGSPSLPTGVEGSSPATVTPPQPAEEQSTQSPNLDRLAHQIYPLIKRMLAVERERKWGR